MKSKLYPVSHWSGHSFPFVHSSAMVLLGEFVSVSRGLNEGDTAAISCAMFVLWTPAHVVPSVSFALLASPTRASCQTAASNSVVGTAFLICAQKTH